MPTLSDQLTRIVDRSTKIIDLCVTLQKENDLLRLDNQSLKVAVDVGAEKIKNLEEKVKALTVARTLDGLNENVELINEKNIGIKQKIDDFVREIDKCILLLK